MGQAPGQAPHPVSPPPYMGQAPGQAPHPVSPPPYVGQAPGQAPQAAGNPGTVFGEPLWPGERVLYFKYLPGTGARIFYFIAGVPMIVILGFGFYLLYLAITYRRQFAHAQVITNKRLFALDGRGKEMAGMRWESVVGLNKVAASTGLVRQFGVRNAQGATFLFGEDLKTVERLVTLLSQSPAQREALPEVRFDPHVH